MSWKSFGNSRNAKRCTHKAMTRCLRPTWLKPAGPVSGTTSCVRCLSWSHRMFRNVSPPAGNSRSANW
jgi:hypothetical protein